MTIQLTAPILIAGAHQALGTSLTLSLDAEAELVNRGVAVYTSRTLSPGEALVPVMLNAAGNAIVDPTTGAGIDFLSLPGKTPNGLDWISETLHGYDIYKNGFVQRPTLFFDPSATASRGLGTFQNPYNSQAQLQAVFGKKAGDMSGTVLGFKRGTKLTVTGNGLELYLYASDDDPVIICPYGDAEALPIISGEESLSGWAVYSGTRGQAGCIYSHAYTPGNVNAWYNTVRLQPRSAVAGINGAGQSAWVTNVLYVRLPDEADPDTVGTALLINGCTGKTWATKKLLNPLAPQVAASGTVKGGNVTIVGLDLRYAHDNAIRTGYDGLHTSGYASAAAAIDALGTTTVVGSRWQYIGTDGLGTSCAGLSFQGINNAVRSKGNVIGCLGYDIINNMVETNSIDGGEYGMQHCIGEYVGGASILELWSSSSNWKCRYNVGNWSSTTGRISTSYASNGAWQSDKTCVVADASNTTTATRDADFQNNDISHNLVMNAPRAFFWRGGTNCKVMNNTAIFDLSATPPGHTTQGTTGMQAINAACDYTLSTPPANWLTYSNNLYLCKGATASLTLGYFDTLRPPAGQGNIVLSDVAARWWQQTNGASSTAIGTRALSDSSLGAGFSQYNGAALTGGTLTFATEFALLDSDYAPLAGSAAINGGSAVTGIGSRDLIGKPFDPDSPNAGCYE